MSLLAITQYKVRCDNNCGAVYPPGFPTPDRPPALAAGRARLMARAAGWETWDTSTDVSSGQVDYCPDCVVVLTEALVQDEAAAAWSEVHARGVS